MKFSKRFFILLLGLIGALFILNLETPVEYQKSGELNDKLVESKTNSSSSNSVGANSYKDITGSFQSPPKYNLSTKLIKQSYSFALKDKKSQQMCQIARMMIKDSLSKTKSDQLYDTECTLTRLTAQLPGRFSIYVPYAASWPNGVAARVFETSKGLKVSGISEQGTPPSWNINQ